MIWFPKILACEVDLRNNEVWQDAYYPWLCSFTFTGDQYSLEDQDVMMAWVIIPSQ